MEDRRPRPGVHLLRGVDRVDEVDALVARLGGRVGLRAVLGDLNRRAHKVRVPAPAATWGFRWNDEDMRSKRWWPQGITTSADAATGARDDSLEGRSVLMTSAYSREVRGYDKGARLTLVDLTDRSAIRYRHVLLVEPFLHRDGRVDVRPMRVHAGGIVWHGDYLHVAGTAAGFSSFRLDDIVRVPIGKKTRRLRVRGDRVDGFGYRYFLPLRFTYDSHASQGLEEMRYSFASLDRSTSPHELVAGEYGRDDMTTRLVRYQIDPSSSLLRTDGDGRCVPVALDNGVEGMQGATAVRGTWYVSTSRGSTRRGSLWVGRPGRMREHRSQLPVGPEDLTYWPARDQLWSLSEYPEKRYVFAMPCERFHLETP